MSLRSYHKETLNDNWYEERQAPLSGVLPSDGVKEFKTTAQTHFAGDKPAAARGKFRMISNANVDQAAAQSATHKYGGFGCVLPGPDLNAEKRYFETTNRSTYTHGGQALTTTVPRAAADALQPAGGSACRRVERGKAASGAMGEVFKVNPDPQRDTLAQRSWMYSKDPSISVLQSRLVEGSQQNESEARENENESKPEHFRRKSTNITRVPLHHMGVFVDDEVTERNN